MPTTLLQIGLPGTQEMLIVLLMGFLLLFLVGIPVLVVIFLVRRYSGNDDRIEELEQEVERLREEHETPVEKSDDQPE